MSSPTYGICYCSHVDIHLFESGLKHKCKVFNCGSNFHFSDDNEVELFFLIFEYHEVPVKSFDHFSIVLSDFLN